MPRKKKVQNNSMELEFGIYKVEIYGNQNSKIPVYQAQYCQRTSLIEGLKWADGYIDGNRYWKVYCDGMVTECVLTKESLLKVEKEITEAQTSLF